jgi:hypothetical protein
MMKTKWLGLAWTIAVLLSASTAEAFYNPSTGRWMSRDPIAERGGLNLHEFVLNRPVDAIDRIGLEITYYYGLVGVNIDRGWSLHNRAGTVPYLTGESAAENFVAGAYNTLPTVLNSAEAMFVLGADTLGALIEGAKDFTRWRFHLDAKWDMMLDGIGNAVPILLPEAQLGPKVKCPLQALETRSPPRSPVPRLAAETGTSLVRVGDQLTTVNDVLRNPSLLTGKGPAEIQAIIGKTPGWEVETLGQGTHAGQGWVLREYNAAGDTTGRLIRWHPGGGRHGPDPYWRVSSGPGGKSGIIPGGPEP